MKKKNETANQQKKYYQAIGRRKTAVASVRIKAGKGEITANGQDALQYFDNSKEALETILEPMILCGQQNSFDISIQLKGGGKQSQVEAARLGLARALVLSNSEYKAVLKKSGFLTRDPREKERKKPGLKRARRAPQWSKR